MQSQPDLFVGTEARPKRRVNKTEGHQRYRLADQTIVPGVTTVIGVLDKPYLVGWANRIGLEGIDRRSYTDVLKDSGTLLHAMVQAHFGGWEIDTAEFSADQISNAETGFLKFLDWEKRHTIEVRAVELQLVSEKYRYGGTLDLYLTFDGLPMLVDEKTSKRIYDETALQLAGLRWLLHENGHDVGDTDRNAILRLGRNESEGFEFRQFDLRPAHLEMVVACRRIYELKKELF